MVDCQSKKLFSTATSLAVLVSLCGLLGCNRSSGSAPAASGAPNDAALIATGKAVFDANGCARCHALGGQGGGRAPDLTHVGADPSHTPQWLAEHVKNPKAQNPSSRMPAFEGRISDSDLNALGVYLASLK
jgi:mono/diheme cytochrome c family protein